MTKLPLFIVLTGPSGSGKSTAMEGVRQQLKQCPRVVLPLRATTRPPRVSDSPEEVYCISGSAFQQGVDAGTILIAHQIRDKWNGLIFPKQESADSTVYMQALPTSAGVAIKEQHGHEYNVIILRLKATKHTVLQRLSQRGPKDDAPADEAAARAQVTPVGNDFEIDAEHNKETVRDAILQVIDTCLTTPKNQWNESIAKISTIKCLNTPTTEALETITPNAVETEKTAGQPEQPTA